MSCLLAGVKGNYGTGFKPMFYLQPLIFPEEENFTDRYLKLTRSLLSCDFVQDGEGIKPLTRQKRKKYSGETTPLNEKILRILWYEQKFERRGLRTLDRTKISILSPGQWNLDEGPDFKGAEIRFGEKIISGDIEIDLKASDWKKHKHCRDGKYNQVILHIFFHNDCREENFARKMNGEPAQRVELQGALREGYVLNQEEVEGYPFRSYSGKGNCGKKISPGNYPLVEKLLLWAGAGRFLSKTERFNQRLKQSSPKETMSPPKRCEAPPVKGRGPNGDFSSSVLFARDFSSFDQLLYEGIMEGLGYKANREPMLALARLLPLEKITGLAEERKSYEENISSEERVYLLEAFYFYLAGLLPRTEPMRGGPEEKYFSIPDTETRTYLEKLRTILRDYQPRLTVYGSPLTASHWVYKGVRPANFPLRRLSGMSHFLNNHWQAVKNSLFLSLYKEVRKANSIDEIKNIFCQPGEGYFAERSQFSAKRGKKTYALIGEERVFAILANTVFPLFYLYALKENDSTIQKLIYSFYHSLKKINTNRIAKLMAYRLFGADKIKQFPIESEQKQQGLLQIFEDFCDTRISACEKCFFPQIFDLSAGEIVK